MLIPRFSESNHPIIQALFDYSDQELLTMFQNHPEQGKYFTAIFCRYSQIIYTLIQNAQKEPKQTEYLFAVTWREIFYQMRGLALSRDGDQYLHSLQNWLIYLTALCINHTPLPPSEAIDYDLNTASPPLWCYLKQALDTLPPTIRFILVTAEKFAWSLPRIVAYLQAEGEVITSKEAEIYLHQGYQMLQAALPDDIQIIYFEQPSPLII